jgi:thioredoxin-like negative regulator of GroEL
MKYTYLLLALAVAFFMLYCVSCKETYQSQKEVILFSMIGCGHCQHFKPTWNALRDRYSQDDAVKLTEVSVNEEPEKVKKFDINGFPTILILQDGSPKEKYQGDRSYEDVINFIEKYR